MAKITLTTLGATAFNGSFVSQLNTNLTKLATAVNDGVLWRATPLSGQNTMYTDLDMNGQSILNASIDGASLLDVKRKAFASVRLVEDAKEWAEVAGQYAASANDAELGAIEQLALTKAQVQISAANAIAATQQAERATQQVNNISSSAAMIAANTSQLSALAASVSSQKTYVDASINSINTAIVANKASADATASTLNTLSSTVAANKTSADTTASSLSTLAAIVTTNKTSSDTTATALTALTRRVATEESKVQSVSLGGTGATTVTAARTALGVGYTASTSSTQQIYYFDNGMMVVHYTVIGPTIAASSSAAHTWTFPFAFSQAPYVNVRSVSGNSAAFLTTFESESTTSASGYLVNNSGSSVTPVLHYFAFGVKA